MRFGLILFLIIGMQFWACQSSQKQPKDKPVRLTTNIGGSRLRESAGEDGKVIRELPKGAVLYDLGEVSNFTTRLKLRGIWFDEPWLKVRTDDGTEGWVYGGALNFEMSDDSKLANLLMEKRLQALFGVALADSIKIYRKNFQAIQSAQDFANVYRKGTHLRDTMATVMQDKIEVGEDLPDLFWLEQAMPGFEQQLVAEGTAYYLFWNYKTLIIKAKATPQAEDDDFVGLEISLFPDDSIEYFYPAWFLQTWDYGGSSLLGRGIHYQTLEKIDKLLKKSDLFTPELTSMKTRLLNDITEPDVTYWENQEKIEAELDSILQTNFTVLNNADKIALHARRQQFAEPQEHNIRLNMQSGTYE